MRWAPAVLLAVLAIARDAAAQSSEPIVEDRAAEAGAVEAGAALVAEGTALGKQNRYEVALGKFVVAATEHPSATHDCLVALAYLRIGRLTLARLWLDEAPRRGDAQPAWCTATISDELAGALATRGFVAVTVEVDPADAEVWVGDAHFRGARTVWLPPGEVEVRAERDGRAPVRRTEPVTDGATIAVALAVAPAAATPVDPTQPAAPTPRRRSAWAWATLAAGGVGLAVGGTFHVLAASTRADANAEPASSARFAELDQRFVRERAVALGGYALGAIGVAVGAWLWTRHGGEAAPAVTVAVGPGDVAATWRW